MDSEFEIEVIDGELVEAPRGTRLERVRAAASSPGVQAAVGATTGFLAGAATLALLRRTAVARGARNLSPVGPSQANWPAGPTVGPIRPGTYLVTVRAIAPRGPIAPRPPQ